MNRIFQFAPMVRAALVLFFLSALATHQLDAVEIRGVLRDGDGRAIAFAQLVLYHQGNHTTVAESKVDGTYSMETESLGSIVILTIQRQEFVATSFEKISVPEMPSGPIVKDFVLPTLDRPDRGKEGLAGNNPPLLVGSSLNTYALVAGGATECVWSVYRATQPTMFSDAIRWERIKQTTTEGAGMEFFRFRLPKDVCGKFQHVKLRVNLEISYGKNELSRVERIVLLSRDSGFANLIGANFGGDM